jgi:hypothetical protein
MITVKGGLSRSTDGLRQLCVCSCHRDIDNAAEQGYDADSCACGCPPILSEWEAVDTWLEMP